MLAVDILLWWLVICCVWSVDATQQSVSCSVLLSGRQQEALRLQQSHCMVHLISACPLASALSHTLCNDSRECCLLLPHPSGGKWTGAALNPARVIGPLAVFHCGDDIAYIYILAQLLAAILACSIFAFVSGWGPLSPLSSPKKLGITYAEAVRMWITGESRSWGRGRRGSPTIFG